MVKPPVKPSWVIPLASFVTMILAMVGDTIHPGIEVDQAHIETLLMMLLGSGAIGAANSMHKRKTAVEKPKEEPSTDEVTEEIAEKVEEEVEKAKEEIKEVGKRAIQQAVIETSRIMKQTPSENTVPYRTEISQANFDSMTEQQKDNFLNTGGLVNPHMKETEGIKWNNMSDYIDHTLWNDPDKGAVLKYGEEYLYVKVKDAVSGHTLQLFDDRGKLLQIDQKGQNEISRLVMKGTDKQPYPRGSYKLIVTMMQRGSSYAQGFTTEFSIV